MAQYGKLTGHVKISKKGDICHLFRYQPNELAVISPNICQGCDLHDGERGAVGSVIYWHYTQEGKQKTSKQIIEAADDENCMITFKAIGGELAELYKNFTAILQVEEKDDGVVATWTFDFEKPDISVPYPTSLMDILCNLNKELDAYSTTK